MTTWTGTVPTIASGDTTTVPTNLAIYRDVMKALSEAWTAYTPTWTGSSTNPVLGNGSFAGSAYRQVNKDVAFRIVLTTGSTTTYGSGQWIFSLPVPPLSATVRLPYLAELLDTSASASFLGAAIVVAGGNLYVHCDPTTAGAQLRAVSSTVPFTWASGDQVVITGVYEAA